MKHIVLVSSVIFLGMLTGCKKNNPPSVTPVLASAAKDCLIQSYQTNWTGTYGFNNNYKYDNNSRIVSYESTGLSDVKITRAEIGNPLDSAVSSIAFHQFNSAGDPSILTTTYGFNRDGFPQTLPTTARLSLTKIHNQVSTTIPDYEDHVFTWSKGKLVKVEETSPQPGDWEWMLTITYNDKGNVTSIKYELTTGPRDAVTLITISAYDDKPNPYSAMAYWKFILPTRWNISEPEPLIVALSQNNPLDFNFNDQSSRTMKYTYNEKGFPITKTYTNKNIQSGQTATFNETYVYTCKP
ncbi:hypothetical protein [Pedobacter frigoris]|uniref:Uncharacterized protein n=1 Tax=Pedobacter frigoris TaxID=2571272 RepID=A0A4V5NZM1_9SPHI|nr:hypothetical protein [Pedobacter frigoris]TKC07458.1 hypothetical protein FA047_09435 [Pedobacter frigoris]